MKRILALATSMFLVLGIATANFAAAKPETNAAPAKVEKRVKTKTAKVQKHKKHKKHKTHKKAKKAAPMTEGVKK